VGATKRPAYRVIAIDKRRSRDGRALEILGFYDPLTEPATVQLETEKIKDWIGKGAQPSETVVKLMRQAEKSATAGTEAEKPKRATRPSKPKASSKAAAKAKVKAEAAAETAAQPDTEPAAEIETPAGAEAATAEAATAEVEPQPEAEVQPEAEAGGEAPAAEAAEAAEPESEKADA
jgi:small subunit ribosomal protein S16